MLKTAFENKSDKFYALFRCALNENAFNCITLEKLLLFMC